MSNEDNCVKLPYEQWADIAWKLISQAYKRLDYYISQYQLSNILHNDKISKGGPLSTEDIINFFKTIYYQEKIKNQAKILLDLLDEYELCKIYLYEYGKNKISFCLDKNKEYVFCKPNLDNIISNNKK